jgi:serine protease Do
MNHIRPIRLLTLSILAPFALGANALAESAAKTPEIKVDNTPLSPSATTYAPVVDKVAPCIVTISTSKNVKLSENPYFKDPFFRRFFGVPDEDEEGADRAPRRGAPQNRNEKPRKQNMGLGSGVIVSTDGHILTNNHVIDGADDIVVTLGNDKHEYKATKIGTDPGSDLAVLKIDGAKVTAVTFTDSDLVRVGDVVLAVGNPFGLTRSASVGIVSATGRGGMRMAQYENYIQTDASINPGNSGGALVDIQGRLVGINTSIFSRSGGNEGIGFAVPANLARGVMESILKNGRVIRGFLGIGPQEVDEDLAEKFKLSSTAGALVSEVRPSSPAEKAGIKVGDVVTEVNGKKIEGPRELVLLVGAMNPGAKVDVKVLRDGQDKVLTAELVERTDRELASTSEPSKPNAEPDVLDGVTVSDVDPQVRREFNLSDETKGAVVTKVEADSPCAEAGIKAGDVIQEIDRKPVANAKQAVEMSEKVKKEKKVLLLVSTKGAARFVMVERKD